MKLCVRNVITFDIDLSVNLSTYKNKKQLKFTYTCYMHNYPTKRKKETTTGFSEAVKLFRRCCLEEFL